MGTIQLFDFSVGLLRAILWQYNEAARLQSLLADKDVWYRVNQEEFWTAWVTDVFDLNTANDFGLTVWGVILDMPLSFGLPGTGSREVWGFGDNNLNFENGNFGRDASGIAGLTTEQKRLVLKLRYYQIISDGSIPFANYVLKTVLGGGYALDPEDMTITFVFPTSLDSQVRLILEQFDLLPRPAAVQSSILIDPANAFGFDPFYLNFENGTFGA